MVLALLLRLAPLFLLCIPSGFSIKGPEHCEICDTGFTAKISMKAEISIPLYTTASGQTVVRIVTIPDTAMIKVKCSKQWRSRSVVENVQLIEITWYWWQQSLTSPTIPQIMPASPYPIDASTNSLSHDLKTASDEVMHPREPAITTESDTVGLFESTTSVSSLPTSVSTDITNIPSEPTSEPTTITTEPTDEYTEGAVIESFEISSVKDVDETSELYATTTEIVPTKDSISTVSTVSTPTEYFEHSEDLNTNDILSTTEFSPTTDNTESTEAISSRQDFPNEMTISSSEPFSTTTELSSTDISTSTTDAETLSDDQTTLTTLSSSDIPTASTDALISSDNLTNLIDVTSKDIPTSTIDTSSTSQITTTTGFPTSTDSSASSDVTTAVDTIPLNEESTLPNFSRNTVTSVTPETSTIVEMSPSSSDSNFAISSNTEVPIMEQTENSADISTLESVTKEDHFYSNDIQYESNDHSTTPEIAESTTFGTYPENSNEEIAYATEESLQNEFSDTSSPPTSTTSFEETTTNIFEIVNSREPHESQTSDSTSSIEASGDSYTSNPSVSFASPSSQSFLRLLRSSGIDVVPNSYNHINDDGTSSLKDTSEYHRRVIREIETTNRLILYFNHSTFSFYLFEIHLEFQLGPSVVPELKKSLFYSRHVSGLRRFESPLNNTYSCSSPEQITFGAEDFYLNLSAVELSVFMTSCIPQKDWVCGTPFSDLAPSNRLGNTLALVIGSLLAAAVIVGAIVHVIRNHWKSRCDKYTQPSTAKEIASVTPETRLPA